MLATVFSRPGRYQRYAAILSAWLLVYLLGGFLAAKWLFTGTPVLPSPLTAIGLALGAAVFALIHMRSMRRLDSVRPDPGPPAG